jgi:hypothetical protein
MWFELKTKLSPILININYIKGTLSVIKIGSRREKFPVRESKCVGLLIMFVKPLIEKISFTLFKSLPRIGKYLYKMSVI